MAEDQGSPEQPNGNDTSPQVGVISQYVKDLSFENPNAPAVYQWQTQPQIAVEFNIGVAKLSDEIHEVSLRIEVRATADGQTAFAVDLLYAGLIGVRNIDEASAQPFLLAEAPRILFPFARQIIAQTVQDGGFAPLMLDPIDFHALYLAREAAEANGGGTGEGVQAGEMGQA
ncbi:MAG TPA: protein-export chaperone SecB [Allosphingosinicella sp.]|nr:protein-export chaperone SecB [Allosphingosinicella sp.]